MTDDLRTGMARAMAESAGLDWDALSDTPDIACGHGMPEGCRSYWLDIADAAIAHYTAHLESDAMVERVAKAVSSWMTDDRPTWKMDAARRCARAVIAAQVAAMGEGHG